MHSLNFSHTLSLQPADRGSTKPLQETSNVQSVPRTLPATRRDRHCVTARKATTEPARTLPPWPAHVSQSFMLFHLTSVLSGESHET